MSEVLDNQAPEAGAAAPEADETPDAVFESVAKEMGWSPKEKWRGDPDKHVDAKTFIKNTPKVIKASKDQLERSQRVAAEQIERNRKAAIEDAEARIAAAAEAGDKEGARAATEDLRRANERPDPQVEAFVERNPWYTTNKRAAGVAFAAAQEVADNGGTVAEQLAAGEKEARKRFPELFGDQAEQDEEIEPERKAPPQVQGGQRTAQPTPRKKGWNDLPKDVQRAMTPKTLKSFGLSEAEYAASYFKENG